MRIIDPKQSLSTSPVRWVTYIVEIDEKLLTGTACEQRKFSSQFRFNCANSVEQIRR